ncbi:hypothetical protein [Kribbella sp. VKM Ac-2568]|uniref:hypothetical protein n=1 Tax=Kribbella sp. VKM Ac-2568 TaxID=2512219 RepID=UPI0010470610|nr:hypothetical protein [Kribbella sp. VKM Ac-2568]TCM39487.1 hypothetical protein EV648_1149 [Kribbella sp. VKM Ac-2568]
MASIGAVSLVRRQQLAEAGLNPGEILAIDVQVCLSEAEQVPQRGFIRGDEPVEVVGNMTASTSAATCR